MRHYTNWYLFISFQAHRLAVDGFDAVPWALRTNDARAHLRSLCFIDTPRTDICSHNVFKQQFIAGILMRQQLYKRSCVPKLSGKKRQPTLYLCSHIRLRIVSGLNVRIKRMYVEHFFVILCISFSRFVFFAFLNFIFFFLFFISDDSYPISYNAFENLFIVSSIVLLMTNGTLL